MSFSNRVASFAAFSFAVAALIGLGTPGFAQDLGRVINAQSQPPVPQPVLNPAVAPAPADAANDSAAGQQDDDEVIYPSLDAAVAAQALPETIDDDLQCMAGAIYFEAKGEPLSGQLAVAEVILNRSKSGRFPKTVCSVVKQPGQFSFVRGGRVPAISQNKQYRTALAVARVALADVWDSPASGAMYFHARGIATGWHREQVAAIGNHVFFR